MLIVLVSSLALGQGAMPAGQQPQTTKGAVIKGKAPVNKEVLKVKLPRAQEAITAKRAESDSAQFGQGADFQHAARRVEWWTFRQA